MRKFPVRLTTVSGLHPDMMLPSSVEGDEENPPFLPMAIAKDAAVGVHPDLDWLAAPFEPEVSPKEEACLDPIDAAISLDELQREEEHAENTADERDISSLNSVDRHPEIDWQFELAWAGASEEVEQADTEDVSWADFDFDVADLGPDPEAMAEALLAPDETTTARDRRLDGVAADLVLALGSFRTADRRALYGRFRTIVDEFQHPASHAALHRMLAQGASLEEIEEAAQLRCIWRDQPWLWAEKRSALSSWNVRRAPSQRLAFGWPTAMRLVRIFGLVEAERSMVEDWFDAWTGLERAKATSPVDEMAFFTYAGFLRQLTPDILLETSEGVFEDAADGRPMFELRDPRGALIWQFAQKLPPRAGEISLEPIRIRNHRSFEEEASESRRGLSGVVAISAIEANRTGFSRSYHFPDQEFDGREGARARVSSLSCHGMARIVHLDRAKRQLTLAVSHGEKRLLELHVALISEAPASPRIVDAARSVTPSVKDEDENT